MWIRLTKTDFESVMVNFDRLTHVSSRTGGGSSLHFDIEIVDKNGDSKQRVLAIKETVAEVYDAVMETGGTPAAIPKLRTAS
jgi:hypothetical protein